MGQQGEVAPAPWLTPRLTPLLILGPPSAMLDWLRRKQGVAPTLSIAGEALPIHIRRLPHARRLTLRLAPDGSEIRITMPSYAREAEALAFARARADWLAVQRARLPTRVPLAPGAMLPFRGVPHRIEHQPALPRRPVPNEGAIRLGGGAESIEPRLKRWLLAEARALFAADLADYAAAAGLSLPPLALSSARARWGSCSTTGIVRLNWRLVMAPDAVRRSVVAHEVAHLIHFDHSPRFHALLARLFEGDLTAANAWLKAEGRSLYGYFG